MSDKQKPEELTVITARTPKSLRDFVKKEADKRRWSINTYVVWLLERERDRQQATKPDPIAA